MDDLTSVMPDVSRALSRGDPSDAYFLIRGAVPTGTAGSTLLALIRTSSGWAEKVHQWRPPPPPRETRTVEAKIRAAELEYLLEHSDESPLTARETAVLFLVAEGLTNAEIGEILTIAGQTVATHVKHILEALGALNRAHAVMIGLRLGVIV